MHVEAWRLRGILRIAHETSQRGAGLCLRDALKQARYADFRDSFGAQDLLPLIRDDRALVQQWVMYSEDKRTDGGWYLIRETRQVGRIGAPREDTLDFRSIEEAVAEYVVRELDFWAALERRRQSS